MTEPSAASHREELMLLYQITVGDLSYFKTQQWAVANYAFLLLAGITGVHQLAGAVTSFERIGLAALALSVAIVVLVVLTKLQTSIRVRQARLEATRKSFSLAFKDAWAAETKGPELVHAIWFLYGAVVLGALIVVWLILRTTP